MYLIYTVYTAKSEEPISLEEDSMVSKTYMTRVQSENTRLRHYPARLNRKTLCYSKSIGNVRLLDTNINPLSQVLASTYCLPIHPLIQQRPQNHILAIYLYGLGQGGSSVSARFAQEEVGVLFCDSSLPDPKSLMTSLRHPLAEQSASSIACCRSRSCFWS